MGGSRWLRDHATAHIGALEMEKLKDLQYELLEHPPYTPELAPSYVHLFPNLTKCVARKHFESNEDVIVAVDGYFADLPKSHFRDETYSLEKCWTKCIELKENYEEK